MDNGASSYRRYLDGDTGAFDEIIKEYFDNLIFFIDRYVQDAATAEDIAIDVFSELVAHPHRYNFQVSLKTYLFMLGRSRALNYIKHRKRYQTVELSEAADLAVEESPEQRLLADEKRLAVNSALAQLSEPLRTVVHLVYFEDMRCEDAAKVMKKTRKQIYNLLYRAKEALRSILGEEEVL